MFGSKQITEITSKRAAVALHRIAMCLTRSLIYSKAKSKQTIGTFDNNGCVLAVDIAHCYAKLIYTTIMKLTVIRWIVFANNKQFRIFEIIVCTLQHLRLANNQKCVFRLKIRIEE